MSPYYYAPPNQFSSIKYVIYLILILGFITVFIFAFVPLGSTTPYPGYAFNMPYAGPFWVGFLLSAIPIIISKI